MQPMNDTGDQDCDPLLFPSKMRLSHTHCFGAWVCVVMQKLLELGKACCRFTSTSVGSTFASWHPFDTRRVGRPRHFWESKLHFFSIPKLGFD